MLKVDNISKTFGDFTAVDGVSFEAKDGEITGILGPNGAGKTTCLRILYGLLKPTTGYATIDGIDVQKSAITARKSLGIFPDQFGMSERLTAREQIEYFAQMHGLTGAALKEALDRVIKDLDMAEISDRRTEGFSQGQRMKVTLAQALVHRPKNLVLDEPTRGLDVMSTRLLREQLRKLKDEGHCILFSSHVMQEVAALCDRVIVVAKGKIVANGSPEELCKLAGKDSLEDAFVAIIGSDEGVAA
ncbi:MAG: ATP-binding cassette domain-containing protein [Gammaproteobacteria bacterium]|nr:ATP-binding cassette domain-containing protein [Gammaproteobacteria bacterium]